ncbi:unnamed protein product [Ambrosiozyma monospora]|uniref:Unnamed protein product n=1 Tax=Ambrosiozyma monospora TaxID=43982 RepID=A0ACB5UB22_AMBMO|nr:unnamed protein product [Ambrosiozyma monospora]
MLKIVKPEVVGHFDLVRLMSLPDEDKCELTGKLLRDVDIQQDWPDVWALIVQNVEFIVGYGGLVEFNSAAIRKGWETAYPKPEIVELILQKGGKFCLSDDSHGVKQVGLNYQKVLKYLISIDDKLKYIHFWDLDSEGKKFINKRTIDDLAKDEFWKQYES